MGSVNAGGEPSIPMSQIEEAPVGPHELLAELAKLDPSVPLVVDLDETLLLTNSTEEYLDSLRPRLIGHALLMLLGLGRPWALWPVDQRNDARDVIRVLAATILMPWSCLLWRSKARRLGREQMNPRLMSVVAARNGSTTVVATNGFRFIVKPILEAAGLADLPETAVGLLRGTRDRARRKPSRTIDAIGDAAFARAVVVTDSPVDKDLVSAANRGFIVRWPEATYRKAMSSHYLPFIYLDQVKHPGQKFFLKTVIADDWLVSVLAIAWIADNPVTTAAGMLFLMLGWWTIYEVGYHENDRLAEALESDPALRIEYFEYQVEVASWQPWAWALVFTAGGVWVFGAGSSERVSLVVGLAWIGLLVVTRLTFGAYNHVDKNTRRWLYPVLHIPRTYGLAFVLSVNAVGAVALAAQLLSRWVAYLLYRQRDGVWPGPAFLQLTRLVVFGLMFIPIATALGFDATMTPQLAAIVAWFAVRARRGLRDVAGSVGRVV